MKVSRLRTGVVAGVAMLAGFSGAMAADPASDNASAPTYLQFPTPDGLNGLNGGTGFGAWSTSKLITGAQPGWVGFAGWFQAFGQGGPSPTNPDLQDAVSGPSANAWGSYANSGQPGQGLTTTTAARGFNNPPLQAGQTFRVQMEHGNVSFYPPVLDLRVFGWVGVILHTTPSYGADPFLNGIAFGGVVGFGFRGGAANYELITGGGSVTDTGIPFTQRGLEVSFNRDTPTTMSVVVRNMDTNQTWTITNVPAAGQINGFGLVNRNAQEANVYFNNVSVTGAAMDRGACCTGAVCVLRNSADCTGPGLRFAGFNTVCNAPGNVVQPCCLADFNQNGSVSVQDLFDYLAAWFGADVRADINQANGVSVQDLFDYLAAWFAGCA